MTNIKVGLLYTAFYDYHIRRITDIVDNVVTYVKYGRTEGSSKLLYLGVFEASTDLFGADYSEKEILCFCNTKGEFEIL